MFSLGFQKFILHNKIILFLIEKKQKAMKDMSF